MLSAEGGGDVEVGGRVDDAPVVSAGLPTCFAYTFVDTFLFVGALALVFLADNTVKDSNVDGDVEEGCRANDLSMILAGLPTREGVALGIMIVFWQFSY